jgi:AcrR family transcriptional regulator
MKQDERKEITRKKILNSAFRITLDMGFSNATTREIAKEAGLSEGAIFYHFKDKKILFEKMVEEYARDYLKRLEVALSYNTDSYKLLMRLIELHIERFISKESILNLVFGPGGGAEGYHIKVIFNKAVKPYIKFISKIFTDGIKRGIFIDENEEFLAASLLGMVNIFCIMVVTQEENIFGGREEIMRVLKLIATRAFVKERIT